MDLASTRWEAQNLTENAPETHANARQPAGNNAPGTFEVRSDINSPTPKEITPGQLRTQLYGYYTDDYAMGPTIALVCLQVVLTTVILFRTITTRDQVLAITVLSLLMNVFCVQPANSFMTVLFGLVLSTDGEVLGTNNGSSRGRRHRWRRVVLGWGLAVVLLALDIGLLIYNVKFPTLIQYALLYYCCGVLGCVCAVGFWDITQPQAAWQRWRQQGRTDTLPLVEGVGHELEAV